MSDLYKKQHLNILQTNSFANFFQIQLPQKDKIPENIVGMILICYNTKKTATLLKKFLR